jgi:hypothetical protein
MVCIYALFKWFELKLPWKVIAVFCPKFAITGEI